MDKPKLKAFVAAVDADSGSLPKLVFADWLAENGDVDAEQGLRWCVKHGKWPHFNTHYRVWVWYVDGVDRSLNRSTRRMPMVCCWLPELVGREMLKRHPDLSRTWPISVRRVGWVLRRLRELVN